MTKWKRFWPSPATWALAILLAFLVTCQTDSTDGDRWNRSGLRLHVDRATGCHYLSTIFGGPTPRLDAVGEHVCSGPEQQRRREEVRE